MHQQKKPKSPFTQLQDFNKQATNQDTYHKSENPTLFQWNLSYQQFNQFAIPKPFVERHYSEKKAPSNEINTLVESTNIDFHLFSLVNDESQHQQQQKSIIRKDDVLLKSKRISNKYLNKKQESPSSQLVPLKLKQSELTDKRQYSLIKTLSSWPLEKLEKVYHDKAEDIQQVLSKTFVNQATIKPKYKSNESILHYVRLVENNCKQKRKKPKQTQSLQQFDMVVSPGVQNIQSHSPFQGSYQLSQEDNDEREGCHSRFRIKTGDELNKLISAQKKNIQQTIDTRKFSVINKRNGILSQVSGSFAQNPVGIYNLSTELNRKFNTQITKFTALTSERPDEKYFFNYRKYFIKNYQSSNNGLNARLSSKTGQKIEGFQNMVNDMITGTRRIKTNII